uniref:56 kDa type-specific antigen n=5 Tax=Orientia tsutsugamushi TaxID=784 RepID=TSAS_ORITS|nr:RecName: Full=56 kDa type-specific antigen; Short=TSA; AltName: Full=56 kDa scrub typhus antigen; AltName: Full=STA56; AltName: Full=TSS56; Flags: Precursor [Orientia tsutsugamushi]AAA26396.1 56 kDa type-specific antigen [Orientia tsutsugamushi]BAM11134.1 56kDa type-specific antigen [Orientia tsutsugamushi]BAM71414.1 56kDa type-specific antigen [Orientia tsutsugamushi]BBH51496.1 56-kDa protein [Orientia tsutsugamushi]
MRKIMLIASAMSALSLPFSANAIEFDENSLECGPYAKVGIVGGVLSGVESARLDPADSEGKKHLPLIKGMPFGVTLAAGMTITPGVRAEISAMYLMNVKAEVELGKMGSDANTGTTADASAGVIRKHKKLTPPQPNIMPISIADRDIAVDIPNAAGQGNVDVRAAARIAWLKNYAGIDYYVPDSNNPQGRVVNPVLLNIPQGNPNPAGGGGRAAPAAFDILDHAQWRDVVVGITALSNANKPNVSAVKILSDKISQIYADIKPFANVASVQISETPLPDSASVDQIQNKVQELNKVLEDVRESFDGFILNAFAQPVRLNFQIPQVVQGQGQQPQAAATAQEAAAAAAIRALNDGENNGIIQLYKDLYKLQRNVALKKSMKQLGDELGVDQGQEGGCSKDKKQSDTTAEESKKEGKKGKEIEFDLHMAVGQVKLYADLFTIDSFSVYAGIGAGLAYTHGKIDGKDIKAHTGMVGSLALGVAANVADGVYMDVDAGYLYSFSKIEEKYQMNAFVASAGIRYNF